MTKQKNNTTGYRGISREKGRYIVRIHIAGKYKNFGRFDTLSDAVDAWHDACRDRQKIDYPKLKPITAKESARLYAVQPRRRSSR